VVYAKEKEIHLLRGGWKNEDRKKCENRKDGCKLLAGVEREKKSLVIYATATGGGQGAATTRGARLNGDL